MAQERRYEGDYRRDDDWSGDWQDWESADRSDYGRARGTRGAARELRRDQPLGGGRDIGGGESYGRGRDYMGGGNFQGDRFRDHGGDYPGRNYARSDLARSEYGRGSGARGSDWPRRGSDFTRDDYGEGYNYGRNYESGFGYPPQSWRGSHQGNRYRGDYGRQENDYGRYGEERSMWDRATDEVSSWFGDDDAERRRQMDQHRGRGPKNYTRSDDRIREDVCDRLSDDWSVDASEIDVSVDGSEVTLAGTVTDRRQRRRAEDCVEQVSGVKHVQNNLRVNDQSTADASGMMNQTGTTASTGETSATESTSSTGSYASKSRF